MDEQLTQIKEAFDLHAKADHDYQEADRLEKKQIREALAKQNTDINAKLNAIEKKLDPILDVYRAILLSKSFVSGLGTIIIGIMAIGAAVLWLGNFISSKH